MIGPDKKKLYPNENIKTVCYLSNLPKDPMLRLEITPTIVIIKIHQRNFMII